MLPSFHIQLAGVARIASKLSDASSKWAAFNQRLGPNRMSRKSARATANLVQEFSIARGGRV